MNALIETQKIEANGKVYPIAFNINVIAEIQDKYRDLETWFDKLSPSEVIENEKGEKTVIEKTPNIKMIREAFTWLINEGFYVSGSTEFIGEREAGVILTELGLEKASEKIREVFVNSMPAGDSKNA